MIRIVDAECNNGSLMDELSPVSLRGPLGLSGTGQWETHRCSDGLVDQADGLPHHRSGPGAGTVPHHLTPHTSAALASKDRKTTPKTESTELKRKVW